jgi:cytochrome P450
MTMSAGSDPDLDLFSPTALVDPHPTLHRMRETTSAHFSPQLGGWLLTRHADILAALKDSTLGVGPLTSAFERLPEAARAELKPLRDSVAMWMGHTVHADHLRFQALLKRYFTPAVIEKLRPRIQAITTELLDAAEPQGGMDVVRDLARPLPAAVIAEMLGMPRADQDALLRWSRHLVAIFQPMAVERLLESQESVREMTEYMRGVVAQHRQAPAGRENIIDVFLAAEREGLINEEEILANCSLLLFAGHETTAALISKGLLALLQHPEQWELMKRDPSLIPQAVEEMLRHCDITTILPRVTTQPTQVGNQEVGPSQILYACYAAANRDPAVFPDPDRFDITRRPDRHMAFGFGAFYCLGASLARAEAHVAFEALARRFPGLRLDGEPVIELAPPIGKQVISLRVAF